jgi:hypothetical protein
MQHYATLFHVFVIAKREKYFILQIDKQEFASVRQFKNMKMEFCYNIIALQVRCKFLCINSRIRFA